MISIDPQRVSVLRQIAGVRRQRADSLMQAASDEMRMEERIRKEIRVASRRHERDGQQDAILADLRARQGAAQRRIADACERSEIAQEEARVARKLLTRCETYLDAQTGGEHGL